MPTYSPKGRSKPSIILTVKEAEIFKRYDGDMEYDSLIRRISLLARKAMKENELIKSIPILHPNGYELAFVPRSI